jgi:hypothetical protein
LVLAPVIAHQKLSGRPIMVMRPNGATAPTSIPGTLKLVLPPGTLMTCGLVFMPQNDARLFGRFGSLPDLDVVRSHKVTRWGRQYSFLLA